MNISNAIVVTCTIFGALFHVGIAIFSLGKTTQKVSDMDGRVKSVEVKVDDHETRISHIEGGKQLVNGVAAGSSHQ